MHSGEEMWKTIHKSLFKQTNFVHVPKKKISIPKFALDTQKPGMPRKRLPALRIDTFVNVREAKQDRSCSAELRSILCERYPNKRAWGPWNSVEHLRSVCSTSLNPLWIQLYKQIRVGYSCQGLWSPLKWKRKGLSSACCSICPADWQLLVKLCINVYNSLRFLVLRQALYCWGLWL